VPRLRALDFEVAFRAAIAAVLPLLVLLAIGRIDWAPYAAFGAFTALYGRGEPYRARIVSLTIAAIGLLVCMAAGTTIASTGAPLWVTAIVLVAVTTGGTLVAMSFDLLPRGALFFVFALLVCAQVPTPAAEWGPRMLVAVCAASFAWLLGMSGAALRRWAPARLAGVFRPLERVPRRQRMRSEPRVWLAVVQNGLGALAAGAIAVAFGIGHPYWSVVSLVAVIPPPHGPNSIGRAIERVVGTIVGLGAAAALLTPHPPAWLLIIAIGVCHFGAEVLVGWFYAAALIFVTPLALSVSELGGSSSVGMLLGDRLIETVIGAGTGLVLVVIGRLIVRELPGRSAGQ
jgi:hypothetical protein